MKLKSYNWIRKAAVAAALCGVGLGFACSKKKSDSSSTEDSDIVIAGSLALTESSALRLTADVTLADLAIYCVTFTLPPVAGTGSVNADGAFELTLATSDASVGCFILKGEDVLGSIVFEDPSKSDLSGNSKTGDRYAFGGGRSDLGTFTFDLTTGKAVVDVTKITKAKAVDTSAAAASAVDFTGSYVISSSGLDMPKGYVGTCSAADRQSGKDCNGPTEGEKLWLKVINGTNVKDGSAAHALMIWQDEALFKTCGSKLGVTFAQAKEHGIDFTSSGLEEGEFDWDASLVDGWKDPTARARNSMMKMENVDSFKGYPGTKQYFSQYRTFNCQKDQPCDPKNSETVVVAEGFQFNANTKDTGCVDADGKPMQMTDWSGMECTFENLTGSSEGLNKSVCSKTVNNAKVTCTHIGGTFKSDGTAIANAMTRYPQDYVVYAQGSFCDYNKNGKFDESNGQSEWPQWSGNGQSCNNGVTITPGQLCKDITTTDEAGKLAQLRCYMEARQGGGKDGETTTCSRDVRGNWSAKTADEFLSDANGPARANGEHVFELFDYDTATSGTMRGEEHDFRGIQVGDNWTDCEVINVFSISLRKYADSDDLLAEMVQDERNVSNKPACIAEYGEGKTQKMLFKLEKQ